MLHLCCFESLTRSCSRTQFNHMALIFSKFSTNTIDKSDENKLLRPPSEKTINSVELLGRVGKNPELRQSTSVSKFGSSSYFATFPLATNEISTDNERFPVWHSITVFNPGLVNNVVPKIVQGDRILLKGSIRYNKSTSPLSAGRIYTNIIANELINLTGKYWESEENIELERGIQTGKSPEEIEADEAEARITDEEIENILKERKK